MRRNAAELGRNASKRSGEICRVGSDERGRTLVNKLLQFITTPPRLGDVMIGQKTSIADEESGAKHVKLEERPVPPRLDRNHPGVVLLHFADGIRRDANKLAGILVVKLHHHVQQADAGPVGVNNRFRDSILILKPAQASLSLMKLLLEGSAVAAIRYFLTELFALRLQGLASFGRFAGVQGGTCLLCTPQ